MHRQQKSDQPESIAFCSMVEHPKDVSELTFSLPFMLSKHRSTSAVPCFEDLPCLSLLLMSVRKWSSYRYVRSARELRSIFLQPSLSILASLRSSGNSQAVLGSVCFCFQRLVWELLKTVQNNKWDTIKQSKMCRIENVEEVFQLQPSLAIIKIDKQQRNDRGSNIRIKYISCSKLKSAANYMAWRKEHYAYCSKEHLGLAVVE